MPETFGSATEFIIQERTGEKRTLLLAGRALPYRPITFSGTQRAEFTWYPGNPEATVQVFGAEENNTTINGEWKNRFIKESPSLAEFTATAQLNGEQLQSAADVAILVDDFRRKGQLVEVRWDNFIRVGIITKFNQTWKWHEDVEWEIEFGWISQGDKQGAAVMAGQRDLGELVALIKEIFAKIRAAILAPFEQLFKFIAAVEQLVADIEAIVDAVIDGIATIVDAVNSVIAIAGRLTALFNSLVAKTSQLIDVFQSLPSPDKFIFDALPTFAQEIVCQEYDRGVLQATREMRSAAAEQQAILAKELEPNLLGTYFAKDGDNLRAVSRAYYGVPDEWRSLLAYNQLDTSELFAGQLVLVPKLLSEDF